MSQKATLAALDQQLHAAFRSAGAADDGLYFPPGSSTSVACAVYVERDSQDVGQLGQLRAGRFEVGYVLSSMHPVLPAERGRLEVDGDRFVHQYEISNDGSLSRWLVSRG